MLLSCLVRLCGAVLPRALALVFAVVPLVAAAPVLLPTTVSSQSNPRFFADTGFSVTNDAFWNYFQRRGGVRTFGYPTSREFTLEGFRVQFFQRQVMQQGSDGQVRLLNLLDSGVLPYTRMNGSSYPGVDQAVLNAGPSFSDPRYGDKAVTFVRERAPDTFGGRPVNFGNTATSLVQYSDAFPNGEGPVDLIPVLNVLEITGLPVSAPAPDPNNGNVVYQRFQRLILQYDASTNTTQALLLADFLKAIITGQNLPADLEEQARSSRYYRQYARGRERMVARPDALPGSDLTDAFEREDRPLPAVDRVPSLSLEMKPGTVAVGATFTVTLTATDDRGVRNVSWSTVGSGVPELDQSHEMDCGGEKSCVRVWNAVSRVAGTLNVRARATGTDGELSDEMFGKLDVANTLQGALEQPAAGGKVGGTAVVISGWAADRATASGTGVQAVHVYLDGEQGQGFFLGAAEYGLPREDVARQVNDNRFRNVGYSLTWDASNVASGEHVLNVYALSAVTGRWEKFSSNVTVLPRSFQDDPVIRMIEPAENITLSGSGSTIKGWAADRNAPTGTGVDRVEVWMDGERATPGAIKLGDALYGGEHGSPAQELGDARFTNSGFTLTWNPTQFRPGDHTLYVYAHSSYTDSWTLKKIPIAIK